MRTHLRRLIASLVVPVLFFVLSGEAFAQPEAPMPATTDERPARSADIPPAGPRLLLGIHQAGRQVQGSQTKPVRDSLQNGTVIGAVIGAVALGAFGAILCNALQEPGEPSCLADTVRIAAIGAAIGAGAGLAIDAARTRGPGVRVSLAIKF